MANAKNTRNSSVSPTLNPSKSEPTTPQSFQINFFLKSINPNNPNLINKALIISTCRINIYRDSILKKVKDLLLKNRANQAILRKPRLRFALSPPKIFFRFVLKSGNFVSDSGLPLSDSFKFSCFFIPKYPSKFDLFLGKSKNLLYVLSNKNLEKIKGNNKNEF